MGKLASSQGLGEARSTEPGGDGHVLLLFFFVITHTELPCHGERQPILEGIRIGSILFVREGEPIFRNSPRFGVDTIMISQICADCAS